MDAQTYSIIEALGSCASVELILELLEGPASVEDLSERTGLSRSATSRHLKELALAGVVSKPRLRDAYSVTCDEPTRQMLEATARLSNAILTSRASGDAVLAKRLGKSRFARRTRDDTGPEPKSA
jgi:DNA-binding transcriptional ArsR family regulator